ncbi:T9SS type A sorting domain-containing protein [Flavobacterium sp.]|uniref:T9SS type A sorting domain-containing protein n=1 Tax=Flavobacterium sp. TaxID=239 RepID=UPI00262B7A1E|nr:T9SS type A sorting domain-containing protein [Flavobacterium sp.]
MQAQTISTDYATQINSTFQNLDKTKIPYKLLVDYAMEFEELSAYNGTLSNENIVNIGNYSGIYNTLLMSRVQTSVTGLINPTTFKSNWDNFRQANRIVLSGLYYKYNEFKPDAPNNTITITNGKLFDKYVNGIWQNPYNEKQVFAVSAPILKYNSLTMEVQLPSSLWYTNQSSNIQTIAIDFNDGLGYQAISLGELKTITYTEPGLKEWKYKLTLTNSQILYSHSKIHIEAEIPPTNNTTYNRTINQPCSQDAFGIDKVEFYGTRQYLGIANQAILEIDYASNDCIIHKPLIIVEGFDSGLLGVENPLGENSYRSFKIEAFNGTGDLPSQLYTYDIIYINFKNGKDYMQRNSYLVEDIIKWVNQQKTLAGSTQSNVVLGQSMGGIIARYALRDMENRNESHQTSLYISHDAPHQGANMPLALQYFARHLADQFISTPLGDMNINVTGNGGAVTISDLQGLLNAPGTKQLLANYINSGFALDNTVGDNWRTELRNMGYPQQTRNIALSNGNQCAIPQNFNPSDNLFSLTGNAQTKLLTDLLLSLTPLGGISSITLAILFNEPGLLIGILPGNSKFELEFTGKALPVAGSSSQIYKGRIAFTKTLFKLFGWTPRITVTLTNRSYNSPVSLSYDYYPGGKYVSFISNGGSSASNILLSYGIQMQAKESFDFIPTPSALDVGNGSATLSNNDYFIKYNSLTPPLAPKGIPFANFTTSYNTSNSNETHISFNTRNGNWLATELDNVTNNEDYSNCLKFCSDAKITGADIICTTGNYSVTNEATTTNWSISEGSNLITVSGTNTNTLSITVINPANNGYVTMNCTYSNNTCGSSTVSKRIWVGRPKETASTFTGGNDNVSIGSSNSFTVSAALGIESYQWSIVTINSSCTTDQNGLYPPGTSLPTIINNGNSTTTISWGNCTGTYVVNCFGKNTCGTSPLGYKTVTVYNGGSGGGGNPCEPSSLKVNPNPVTNGEFSVNIVAPGEPCDNTVYSKSTNNNEVKIYDMYGNLRYSNNFTQDDFVISNINLAKGNYILNVTTHNGHVKRKVIIIN